MQPNKSITLTLTGHTFLAGDYNGDSIVDAADYVVWRHSQGASITAYAGADGNGDGVIDDADYDVWRATSARQRSAGARLLHQVFLSRRPLC